MKPLNEVVFADLNVGDKVMFSTNEREGVIIALYNDGNNNRVRTRWTLNELQLDSIYGSENIDHMMYVGR